MTVVQPASMPVLPETAKVDFFRRQVLQSRSITGSRLITFAVGGLNYQIEHHLFPSMPRPTLRRAHSTVRPFCADKKVPNTQTGLLRSYAIVVRYLNGVGLGARDPFLSPLVAPTVPVAETAPARNEDDLAARSIDDLLLSVGAGDRESFSQLYDLTASIVFGLAQVTLGDTDLAEQASQETFRQIWVQAARFDPTRESALSWILAIIRAHAWPTIGRGEASRRLDHDNVPTGHNPHAAR